MPGGNTPHNCCFGLSLAVARPLPGLAWPPFVYGSCKEKLSALIPKWILFEFCAGAIIPPDRFPLWGKSRQSWKTSPSPAERPRPGCRHVWGYAVRLIVFIFPNCAALVALFSCRVFFCAILRGEVRQRGRWGDMPRLLPVQVVPLKKNFLPPSSVRRCCP